MATIEEKSFISLKHIDKIYPNGFKAVDDFNLDIKKNEFIAFVGPSGCGKTTTLRMIAGLEDITGGDLFIDGFRCNDATPKDRDIAMVFQSYALYPHMTVFDNMAFSLQIRKTPMLVVDENGDPVLAINKKAIRSCSARLAKAKKEHARASDDSTKKELEERIAKYEECLQYYQTTPMKVYKNGKLPKAEIKAKVETAAEILGLTEYLKRRPGQLSGGQRQRVALGRAIVRNARVFLMDEPLSNLDAKLRVQMRSEIVKIHQRIGSTTIYVTHDQVEAMTMADRIVIMKLGVIQQIGTPVEIYEKPKNKFVAGFIGSPAMNFIDASYNSSTNKVTTSDGIEITLPKTLVGDHEIPNEVIFGIRPEDIVLAEPEDKENVISATVVIAELIGKEYYVHFDIGGSDVIAKIPSTSIIYSGDQINIKMNVEKAHIFNKDDELAII